MLKKLLELITGDDNTTLQPAYAWGALMVIIGLVLEVWAVTNGKPFDMLAYGGGCGALLALMEGGKFLGK